MRMKNALKKASILILAFALIFSPLAMSVLHAAGAVDTTKEDCSITFQMGADYPELSGTEIPIKLYKVADINEGAVFAEKEKFESLELSSANAETTAEEWQQKAETALKVIEENSILPDAELILNGSADALNKAENLSVGLYLITAEPVESGIYQYEFSSFLMSVPNNYYNAENPDSDDAWVYDVEAQLKIERKELFGGLEIIKTLASYNKTLGPAFFVFQVEAVKDGKNVYSDVVSLNFNDPGQKSVIIERIPAGAEVTVTEIYSGASYTEVTGEEKKTVIEAGDILASVSFRNDYDERLNLGTGVVNYFKIENESWDWEQRKDNAINSSESSGKTTRTETEKSDESQTLEAAESSGSRAGAREIRSTDFTGSEESPVTAAPAAAAEGEIVALQEPENEEAPAEEAEETPEEEVTKVDDSAVPLADMVKEFFSDENSSFIPNMVKAVLALVMVGTFAGICLRKYLKNKADARSKSIKQK